ncbi:iron-containing alcohol dehydrogenase [Treponema phagedenis]|uniref:iron-containing alcohol dehydrogenase n=1 Tax=Treponema phagedenis TaxID=162 RepID=UPI0018CDA57D
MEKLRQKYFACIRGGSIKKNGIYDDIISILKKENKNVIEDAGVMPNPTLKKLYEGIKIAKENKIDFILAVGGGSVCDYAKAVSVSVHCTEDPWEKFFVKAEEPIQKLFRSAVFLQWWEPARK